MGPPAWGNELNLCVDCWTGYYFWVSCLVLCLRQDLNRVQRIAFLSTTEVRRSYPQAALDTVLCLPPLAQHVMLYLWRNRSDENSARSTLRNSVRHLYSARGTFPVWFKDPHFGYGTMKMWGTPRAESRVLFLDHQTVFIRLPSSYWLTRSRTLRTLIHKKRNENKW